jgi:diaminopimelate decarboxylase
MDKLKLNIPYYIINTNKVQKQVDLWIKFFDKKNFDKKIDIRYAVKCNSDVEIINY